MGGNCSPKGELHPHQEGIVPSRAPRGSTWSLKISLLKKKNLSVPSFLPHPSETRKAQGTRGWGKQSPAIPPPTAPRLCSHPVHFAQMRSRVCPFATSPKSEANLWAEVEARTGGDVRACACACPQGSHGAGREFEEQSRCAGGRGMSESQRWVKIATAGSVPAHHK